MVKKNKVLVSGVCGNSYGAQVAKSLSLLPDHYELFGADASASYLVDAIKVKKLTTFPKASSDAYLDALVSFYHDNHIDYYIEGSEQEQKVLNDKRDFLEKNKINWVSNNKSVLDICLDKRNLSKFLDYSSFSAPKIFSFEELLGNKSLFPVILKPYTQSGGSNNVFIAQDMEDVKAILHLSRKKIESYIIQEYVGSPNLEFTVGILHNNLGAFIGSATLKRDLTQSLSVKYSTKNITSKPELGEFLVISSGFSQGLLYQNQEIENYCRTIAEQIKSTGPLNFQGRLVGDKFYVFEINPRFSGTSFMRALSGFNEANLWVECFDQTLCVDPCILNSNKTYKRIIKEIEEHY